MREHEVDGGPSAAAVHPHVAWFLRPHGLVNFVDVSVFEPQQQQQEPCGAAGRVRAFLLDVAPDRFGAMLDRAALHPGYSARSWTAHELRVRDMLLSYECEAAAAGSSSTNAGACTNAGAGTKVRAHRAVLQDATVLPGTSLLVRRYHRAPLPFAAFPHDRPADGKCRVRRLVLRIHRNARLVFEARKDDTLHGQTMRAHIEIELDAATTPTTAHRTPLLQQQLQLQQQQHDLQRTVENTIQVVLMGMQPKVRSHFYAPPTNVQPNRAFPQSV
jgi:hypothetical protein